MWLCGCNGRHGVELRVAGPEEPELASFVSKSLRLALFSSSPLPAPSCEALAPDTLDQGSPVEVGVVPPHFPHWHLAHLTCTSCSPSLSSNAHGLRFKATLALVPWLGPGMELALPWQLGSPVSHSFAFAEEAGTGSGTAVNHKHEIKQSMHKGKKKTGGREQKFDFIIGVIQQALNFH
jgi:hypothetical protein